MKTLLLFIAALSVWLGYQTNEARQQQAAVKAMAAVGATIHYDDVELDEFSVNVVGLGAYRHSVTGRTWGQEKREPRAPAWLRESIDEDFFRSVAAVRLWSGERAAGCHTEGPGRTSCSALPVRRSVSRAQ
ncbi:MAG: hypothetical protein HYS13_21130 [Planctomycetia bacterium]|nr:hypothetical protein [Planctomycetia bacterium]